ncbi:Uncharacterized protein OBRU01_05743, partial [Operophtera brumata]
LYSRNPTDFPRDRSVRCQTSSRPGQRIKAWCRQPLENHCAWPPESCLAHDKCFLDRSSETVIDKPETSASYSRDREEHDLAYFIHDRVELMHQVFSILKYKELKAMAPDCVRDLAVGDLQELCTEELLGISSKRLLATLDGAEPPSDTESSSASPTPDQMETISLDSISSDEEILSQGKQSEAATAGVEASAASEDEVEIKEEAPDVVEISSGDEKPDLGALQHADDVSAAEQSEAATAGAAASAASKDELEISSGDEKPDLGALQHAEPPKPKEPSKPKEPAKPKEPETTSKEKKSSETTVTRRISDLIITVPQAKANRKIRLNRNKVIVTVPNATGTSNTVVESRIVSRGQQSTDETPKTTADKSKKKKKNKKKKSQEKDGIDHDEITLQLSDSEKMDLLEDLNEKNYERLSSNSSDSESSSSDSEAETSTENVQSSQTDMTESLNNETEKDSNKADMNTGDNKVERSVEENNAPANESSVSLELASSKTQEDPNSKENVTNEEETKDVPASTVIPEEESQPEELETKTEVETDNVIELTRTDDTPVTSGDTQSKEHETNVDKGKEKPDLDKGKAVERDISEGELSDRGSSEVEAFDIQPEVVCISDDEKLKSNKKKKKKDKKAKKEKKNKKSEQDFREGADQNFYKDADKLPTAPHDDTTKVSIDIKEVPTDISEVPINITDDDDNVYEILELSDDSSCYEVEGTVLSKEPTADEIQALSARIDEIKREDVIKDVSYQTNETAAENCNSIPKSDESEQELHMCWKDRYLDSTKVKKVLTTANILNAIRKKNKELKRKIEESKKRESEAIEEQVKDTVLEEGSIEHYQTLQGSSTYVNAVLEDKDVPTANREGKTDEEEVVTKEMKKDAKQLLKMYRKLLNSKKNKRREKKKMRKQKKLRGDSDVGETVENVIDDNE